MLAATDQDKQNCQMWDGKASSMQQQQQQAEIAEQGSTSQANTEELDPCQIEPVAPETESEAAAAAAIQLTAQTYERHRRNQQQLQNYA